jgi:multiple sugar transport system permease protein
MSKGISTAHSVVEPTTQTRWFAGVLVALYAFITIVPLAWIILTGFKTPSDAISYPPKIVFTPTIEGYCNLFTTRSRQTPDYIAALPPASSACEQTARDASMVVAGTSLPASFRELFDHRLRVNDSVGGFWCDGGVCVLSLQGAAEG